jgi:hypothetical protein
MNLVNECSSTTGRNQQAMATSQKQTSLFGEEELTSLQGDFLANPTQPPANASEKRMNATSGQKCLEQFERFNHVGLWAKTFAGLLIGTGEWYSTRCKLTWKLKGTKYSRFWFQLVAKTLPTEGKEFGLLPTVTTKNVTGGAVQVNEKGKRQNKGGTEFSAQLHDLAKSGLLPTPTASDATTGSIIGQNDQFVTTKNGTPRKVNQNGQNGSVGLGRFAVMGMLPTPKAQEARGNASNDRGKFNLTDKIAEIYRPDGKTSQLNPRFVAEMMGFPPNWTELPFQSGETNPLKPTETP